jgi:hypothetical protein
MIFLVIDSRRKRVTLGASSLGLLALGILMLLLV